MIRDSLYIPLAKMYFVITSYALYMVLARVFAPKDFGAYGVIAGTISILNMMFINGGVQSVSKMVSEGMDVRSVCRAAWKIQGLLGFFAFILFFIGADALSHFFNDTRLAAGFRASSFVMIGYAFYAVHAGALNGKRVFKIQGLLDMAYSTLKFLLVAACAYLWVRVDASLAGFSSAAILIAAISYLGLRRALEFSEVNAAIDTRRLVYYQFSIMAFAFMMNLIMNTDLFAVKKLLTGAMAAGAGYYTAALTLARVPYMILISLNFILFPILSKAVSEKNHEKAERAVKEGVRIAWGLALPAAVILSANSREALALIYPGAYQEGAAALEIVALGYAALALFLTLCTLITSSGRPLHALALALGLWILQMGCAAVWVPNQGLAGAALASITAMVLGAILAAGVLKRCLKYALGWMSFCRVTLSCGVIYLIGLKINGTGWMLVAESAGLLAVYIGILWILGERIKGKRDLAHETPN